MKYLLGFLTMQAIAYIVIALLLFFFQRSLLFYPSAQQPTETALNSVGLRMWPSSSDFRGITATDSPIARKGTIVIFHGNAGAAHDRSYYIEALSKQQFRVILAEYPGYSGREGDLSEESVVNDAVETLSAVYQKHGAPLYLWGESLGAGVVAAAVSKLNQEIPIKGLVLLTPWDALPDLAQTHYWYLPVRWLVKDQYNSIENLASYKGNVAVVLAGKDEIIPVQHGERLYESIASNKKRWYFEAAHHNTIPIASDLQWWQEVGDFIAQ